MIGLGADRCAGWNILVKTRKGGHDGPMFEETPPKALLGARIVAKA